MRTKCGSSAPELNTESENTVIDLISKVGMATFKSFLCMCVFLFDSPLFVFRTDEASGMIFTNLGKSSFLLFQAPQTIVTVNLHRCGSDRVFVPKCDRVPLLLSQQVRLKQRRQGPNRTVRSSSLIKVQTKLPLLMRSGVSNVKRYV